jgi:hypothetical protein
MKDILGREIKVGDVLVYPVRRRSTIYLKMATVSEPDPIVCLNKEGRRVVLKFSERCAVVRGINEADNS